VWTWAQLGLHDKPCALLDMGGFYMQLAGFLNHVVEQGFLDARRRDALIVESEFESLLSRMFSPP